MNYAEELFGIAKEANKKREIEFEELADKFVNEQVYPKLLTCASEGKFHYDYTKIPCDLANFIEAKLRQDGFEIPYREDRSSDCLFTITWDK